MEKEEQHITSLRRYAEAEEGVHVFEEEMATGVMVQGDPLELQVDRLKGFLSSDVGFSLIVVSLPQVRITDCHFS